MKRKPVIALLSLVTSLTLTACSFQFSTPEETVQVPDIVNTIHIDVAEEISDIIDNADLSTEEGLESLVSEVTEWADSYAEDSVYLEEFQKATLVRVVDGDTIVVDIEGEEYKVRLIGINTPESVASQEYLDRTGKENTEEGKSASDYTKKLLENVETVYLEKDVSETDRYDRFLRYVWLEMPEDKENINEIATKMLNGLLLLERVAEPATYEPDTAYEEDFEWIYENM